ncbi:unnamed protein product [Cylicostephanus goldi]|uniref:Uncharacterized protein n=1 Tax=Cylicostephanus goldi TaxID=71465 RepID=A0A3P6TXE1_CYLGO|nr:unnamed protein product [Cylicostephanus goldi]
MVNHYFNDDSILSVFLCPSILSRYIRWFEDISLKGPVFICSTVSAVTSKGVTDFMQQYKLGNLPDRELDFSSGSILGRAYVNECLTYKDFVTEYNVPVCGDGDFVLIFSTYESLTIPVPYIPSAPFFQLEKEILHVLGNVFGS